MFLSLKRGNMANNILIVILFAVAGALIGFGAKAGKGVSGKELLDEMKGALIPGAIFGAIAGILLSIFSIIALGLNGLLGTAIIMLSGALVGAGGLAFLVLLKSLAIQFFGEKGAGIISGLAVGLIIGLIFILIFMPAGGSAMLEYWKIGLEPVGKVLGSGFRDLAKWRYCINLEPGCPFLIDTDTPNIQNSEEVIEINVNFLNKNIQQDKIDLDVELSVKNPEIYKLHLIPSCFIGDNFDKSREMAIKNMGKYSFGNEFVFGMSPEYQSTSLTCSSNVPECSSKTICSTNAFLVLERPVILQGVWPIYIGKEYNGPGKVRTSLLNNVPYSITMSSPNDMPFDSKQTGGYRFYVTIAQRDEEARLKNIEIIRLSFPENIMADCDYFNAEGNELVIRNINDTWLKENYIPYDSTQKEYKFQCFLYVKSAPRIAEQTPIEIESSYTVISRYQTKLIKQPS